MKIVTGIPRADGTAPAQVPEAPKATGAPARGAAPSTGPLQSAVLQPALGALRDMPEIDAERVAAVREALARGELPFDAGKLAALITRWHGAGK